MTRDYKKRAPKRYQKSPKEGIAGWKWVLSIMLICGFGVFLYFLKSSPSTPDSQEIKLALPTQEQLKSKKQIQSGQTQLQTPKNADNEANPKFDFYTILPEKEVVVPEHEMKTRVREEHIGKAKSTRYMIQAGSFRDSKEADSLKAKLALMGIESNIEKAIIGDTTWNRVKIGPIAKMASANSIRSRLRENHIDVVIMEIN